MNKKIEINTLVVEIGRKCNQCCKHCLRGNAEDKTLDVNLAKKIFKEANVMSFTITGGEPTLYEDEIIDLIDFILQEDIELGSFYIATNGLIKTPKLMMKLCELYGHCYEKEFCEFELSNDEFHEDVPIENKEFLSAFSFFQTRDYSNRDSSLIADGRVLDDLSFFSNVRKLSKDLDFDYQEDDNTISVEMVYLNAEGYLLPDCDYSYNTQREMKPFKYGSMPLADIIRNYNKVAKAS